MVSYSNYQISRQHKEGGFMILLIFLGIIPLLYNTNMDFKVQYFSLWCQNRIYPSSRTKTSSVDHSLSMSFLVILVPTTCLYTSSRWVRIWYGLLVVVGWSYLISMVFYWPKIWIFQVSPQGGSLMQSSRVTNQGWNVHFWCIVISLGGRCHM